MQQAMQVLLIGLLITATLINLYRDINGRPAKEPVGFSGVVSTLISTIISVLIYYFAGAFSTIF